MKDRRLHIIFLLPALCLLGAVLFSCSSNEKQNIIIKQEESIDKYLSSAFKDSVVIRRNGSNRVVTRISPAGNVLEYGDTVYMYYAGWVFNNQPTSLFATNWESVARDNNFVLTDSDWDILKTCYDEHSFIPGLNDGLYGIREGEDAIIVFSAKYGFGDSAVGLVPALSALLYEVLVIRIDKSGKKI